MDNQVYKDMESKLKNKFKYQMWVLYLIEALLFALCTFVFKVTFISTYELVWVFAQVGGNRSRDGGLTWWDTIKYLAQSGGPVWWSSMVG